MKKLSLYIEESLIEIYYPCYIEGMFKIVWDDIHIGYIYTKGHHRVLKKRTWIATTPHVRIFIKELGSFLESAVYNKLS